MMKERYQSMMEQAALSEGAKADLLEKLEQKRPAKKGTRALRAALIAACACVVLVGGAFAATYIAGFSSFEEYTVGDLIFEGIGKRAYSGFRLRGGMTPIPLEEFSEQARAIPEGNIKIIFDSWEEAEQFMGVDLKNNLLLEQLERTVCSDPKLNTAAHCVLRFLVGGDGIRHVAADAYYRMSGDNAVSSVLVNWYALITTENSVKEYAYEVLYPSERELVVEKYTGAGGLETIIVETKEEEVDPIQMFDGREYCTVRYSAYFSLDGVAYCLETWGYQPVAEVESNPTLELLKQIIDAYECAAL